MNGEIAGEVGKKRGKEIEGGGDGDWEDEDEDMEGVGRHTGGKTGGKGILHAEEDGITGEEVADPPVGMEDEIS